MTPKKAFVSYSRDSPAHVTRVAALVHDLRRDGVECLFDEYLAGAPPEGWPIWMERCIEEADYVLVVCTANYLRRVRKEEEPGVGLGVAYEASLIYQMIYEQAALNHRFLPVVFDATDLPHIPLPLRAVSHFVVASAAGYESLLRQILGVPRIAIPSVGPQLDLQPAPSPTLFPPPGQTITRSGTETQPTKTRRWVPAVTLTMAAVGSVLLFGGRLHSTSSARTESLATLAAPDASTHGSDTLHEDQPPDPTEVSDEATVRRLWINRQYEAILEAAPAMLARDPHQQTVLIAAAGSGCRLRKVKIARRYLRRIAAPSVRQQIQEDCSANGLQVIPPKSRPKGDDWDDTE